MWQMNDRRIIWDGKAAVIAVVVTATILGQGRSDDLNGEPLVGHRAHVTALGASRKKYLASADVTAPVAWLWSRSDKKTLVKLPLSDGVSGISSLSFSPCERFLAACSYDAFCVWDVPARSKIVEMKPKQGSIYGLSWAPNGESVAVAVENSICIFRAADGKLVKTLEYPKNYTMHALSYASNSKTLFHWNLEKKDFGLAIDLATGRKIREFRDGDSLPVRCSCHVEAKNWLVSGGYDGRIVVWDCASGDRLKTFESDESSIVSISYLSRHGRLVAGTESGSIWIYDLQKREGPRVLRLRMPLSCMAVTSDEEWVLLGYGNGDISSQEPVNQGLLFQLSISAVSRAAKALR